MKRYQRATKKIFTNKINESNTTISINNEKIPNLVLKFSPNY